MQPLKEIYLSLFLLFYRLSLWKGRMKARVASICVGILEFMLVFTIWLWIQIATHEYIQLDRWIVVASIFLIAGPGEYLLVVRGHGIAFEKQFHSFSKSKRIALYLAAIGVVLATGIAFYLTVIGYHQTFNLPSK